MSTRPIALWCICAFIVTAIFATLYRIQLYQEALFGKSAIVFFALLFAWLAALIELAVLIWKHISSPTAAPMTGEEKGAAAGKVFAALALLATVLSSAEDLSGKKHSASSVIDSPRR